jgi:hypothetical protein
LNGFDRQQISHDGVTGRFREFFLHSAAFLAPSMESLSRLEEIFRTAKAGGGDDKLFVT